jgi:hypothetical protein
LLLLLCLCFLCFLLPLCPASTSTHQMTGARGANRQTVSHQNMLNVAHCNTIAAPSNHQRMVRLASMHQ